MNDPRDSKLDSMLGGHLRSELDAQLGRATARFDQMIRMQQRFADASTAHRAPQTAPRRLHINRFMLGVVGAAVAAAVAAVWIFSPATRLAPTPTNNHGQVVMAPNGAALTGDPEPATLAADAIPVQRDVSWRTVDRGTVFVGEEEQPMRRLVRQRVDNYRWTDPENKFDVEYSIPNDEVMLVGMKTY